MTQLAPLPRDQRKIDKDHLNLLAIFHFVGAGLALLDAIRSDIAPTSAAPPPISAS